MTRTLIRVRALCVLPPRLLQNASPFLYSRVGAMRQMLWIPQEMVKRSFLAYNTFVS